MYWDNGKEIGNYYSILGLYWDNENKMETTIIGHFGGLSEQHSGRVSGQKQSHGSRVKDVASCLPMALNV